MKSLNCFDRIEIPVNENVTHIVFTYNDGQSDISYPFLNQKISISYDEEGLENIEKYLNPYKCVRYSPIKCGKLCIQSFEGKKVVNEDMVEVVNGTNRGYIKVSEKDRRYFEYSDGSSFVPIGINTAYPSAYQANDGNEFVVISVNRYIGINQYRSWFKKLSQNGVNLVRLWIEHDYFSLSTDIGYSLDLTGFSKLDSVISIAKEYGLYLKLTIDKFRKFNYKKTTEENGYSQYISSIFNNQLTVDGKRCKSMQEFLTDESFLNAWFFKVKEIAKRYSGDTAIFVIELWNEMNAVDADYQTVFEWNKKYLPKIKKLFPRNMITNSLGSFDSDYAKEHYLGFCWDKTDFKQLHRYLDQGAPYEICNNNPVEFLCDGIDILSDGEAPIIVAETGAVNNCHSGPFKYYSSDDDGIIFADCVYTPFFAGGAGCGHIWHWDGRYVESKNLYKMFKPFKQLVDGIDVCDENFNSFDCSNDRAYIILLKGKKHILGYVRNKSSNWKRQLRDLLDVEIIDNLSIELESEGTVELIKIWNDNTNAYISGQKLILDNLEKGVMFKVTKI